MATASRTATKVVATKTGDDVPDYLEGPNSGMRDAGSRFDASMDAGIRDASVDASDGREDPRFDPKTGTLAGGGARWAVGRIAGAHEPAWTGSSLQALIVLVWLMRRRRR